MNTRTLAIVSAAVIGTPLFAAAVLTVCSPTVAVLVCLLVAGAGVIGTAYGVRLIAPAPATKGQGLKAKGQVPSGKCQVDTETSDAICKAVEQPNSRRDRA